MRLEKFYFNSGNVIRNNQINVLQQLMELRNKTHLKKETTLYDEKLGMYLRYFQHRGSFKKTLFSSDACSNTINDVGAVR